MPATSDREQEIEEIEEIEEKRAKAGVFVEGTLVTLGDRPDSLALARDEIAALQDIARGENGESY